MSFLQVSPSSQFRREGADVHTDVTISLAQAILGGTVKVPGIYEDTNLQVGNRCSNYSFESFEICFSDLIMT